MLRFAPLGLQPVTYVLSEIDPLAPDGIRCGDDQVCCFKAFAPAIAGRGVFVFGQVARRGDGVFLYWEARYSSASAGGGNGRVFRQGKGFFEVREVRACQLPVCREMPATRTVVRSMYCPNEWQADEAVPGALARRRPHQAGGGK